VLKCVEARDVKGAQKVMAEHLERSGARLTQAKNLRGKARS